MYLGPILFYRCLSILDMHVPNVNNEQIPYQKSCPIYEVLYCD